MAVLAYALRHLSTYALFLLIAFAMPAFAQTPEPANVTNGGGIQSFTPYQFFSNQEAFDLSNGNLSFAIDGVKLPGIHEINPQLNSSFNLNKAEVTLEDFFRVFKNVVPHKKVETHYCGTSIGSALGGSGGCSTTQWLSPDIDRLTYENKTISLGALGSFSSQSSTNNFGDPHNIVALQTSTEGWQISWGDYLGVIVLMDVNQNRPEHPAYVLGIRKDGAAEPFNFATGESFWKKAGTKIITDLGDSPESVEGLNEVRLVDEKNKTHVFAKDVVDRVGYQVDFSYPCTRAFWKSQRCHGSDPYLINWRVVTFVLNRVEDGDGHFLGANVLSPSFGQPQVVSDHLGRQIRRIVNDDSSETWEAPWLNGTTRQWRVTFDEHRRITSFTDPEGNIIRYRYDYASATQCSGCLPARRSMGWDSLTNPSIFVQIEYPTGGVIRYEWFGDPNEETLFSRYIIITEFPDAQNAQVFYQKYYRIVEYGADAEPNQKRVETTFYDANGAVSEYRFEKVKERYLLKHQTIMGNQQTVERIYEWKLNADGLSIDGIASATMQANGGPVFTTYSAEYDDKGRVTSQTDANGIATSYAYVGDADRVRQTTRGGVPTFYEYGGNDVCNHPLQTTWLSKIAREIQGGQKTIQVFCYDDFGNVVKNFNGEPPTDELRLSVSYSESVPPLGTSQNVYDRANGILLSQTNAYGIKTRYSYNTLGALAEVRFLGDAFIQHRYEVKNGDSQRQNRIVTTVRDATTGRNIVTERFFNGLDQLVQEKWDDRVVTYSYTPSKQIQSITYSDGRQISFGYDAWGRVTRKNVSGLAPQEFEYSIQSIDGIPNQVTTVKVDGRPVQRFSHDLLGQLRKLEKLDGATPITTTTYQYDPLGNLTQITTPSSAVIQNAVNLSQGSETRIFPGGDQLTISDSSGIGQPDTVLWNASGRSVEATLRYSANRLLQKIDYPGEQNDLTINYGDIGSTSFNRLVSVDDPFGKTSFAYNAGGAVEVIERKLDDLHGSYKFYQVKNGFGNLVRLIYPNGLIVYYKRDNQNRVTEVRKDLESGLLLASIQYFPNGQPKAIQYANGIITIYTYDVAGRVKTMTSRKGDKHLLQETYSYDSRGRKTEVQHLDGSRVQYDYDALNRVIRASYFRDKESQPFDTQEYSYDLEGNRIAYSDSRKHITYGVDSETKRVNDYKIHGENEGLWQGTLNYEQGNVVSQIETQNRAEIFNRHFTFNDRNQLVTAEINDLKTKFRTVNNYAYDYAGRREKVETNGKAKYYLYGEALDPLMELDDKGEVQTFYIFLGTKRLASIAGDDLQFYHADELDNVLGVTNIDGDVVQTVRYDPFGNITFEAGSEHNPFLFAGKPYEQTTGLYYFGARYYDPHLGRFLSRDPLLQGTNHYIYAENNPLSSKDIFGLWGFFVGISGGYDAQGNALTYGGFSFQAGSLNFGLGAPLQGGGPLLASAGIGDFSLSAALPIKGGSAPRFGVSGILRGVADDPERRTVFNPEAAIGVTFGGSDRPSFRLRDSRLNQNFLDPRGEFIDIPLGSSSIQEKVNHDLDFLLAPAAQNSMSSEDALMAIIAVLDKESGLWQFNGSGSVDLYSEASISGESTGGGGQASTGQSNYPEKESPTNPPEVGGLRDQPQDKPAEEAAKKQGVENTDVNSHGDPILLHSGDLMQAQTDLKIPGRGFDYEFKRIYRSRITYDGPLGFNWDHNYNKYLVQRADGNIARFDGEARFDIYVKNVDKTYTSPSGYFDTLMVTQDDSGKMVSAAITDKHGTVSSYGADGFITQIRDRNGNTMRFEYNSVPGSEFKVLSAIIDTVGRRINYSYNAAGKLVSITDFSGRTVLFAYSNNLDLVSVTNPAGQTMRYAYSSGYLDDRSELNHNLLTVTDAKGQTYLKNTYSIYDRVVRQTFGDEGTFLMEYNQVASSLDCTADLIDKVFYRTTVTDRIGNKIDYVFNCQGNPLKMVKGGVTTQYAYNKDGLLIKQTNPKGDAIQYDYDAKGNLAKQIRLPATGSSDAPLTTTFAYDPQFSQLTSVTDPANHVTTFTLDAKGNVIQKCLPELSTSNLELRTICETYTHNDQGQLVTRADGEGNTDQYTYNDKGFLTQITRDAGSGKLNLTNQFTYDDRGNINSFTDGVGNKFTFEVNALNQVTLEKAPAPLNYERRIEYDANNNIAHISGNAATSTTFTYNILDRVTTKTEVIDDNHKTLTEYQYDLNENLTRIIQPEGNSTSIEYDARDLPYRVTKGYRSNEASAKTFTRDANGNVTAVKDGNGNVTQYAYDGFERLEQITDVAGGRMVVDHDEAGNITSITRRGPPEAELGTSNFELRTSFIYDALNRLIQKTESNDPAQSITKYDYDKNNRLTQLTDTNNQITKFIYDGADRLIQKMDALGNQTHHAYDGNNNVIEVKDIELGTPNLELRTQFNYDALNRLTQRSDNAGHAFTYEYDSKNNLVATTDPKDTPGLDNGATVGSGNKVIYSYDGLNRLIQRVEELKNNGAGNGSLTDTITTQYNYDDNNRLIKLIDANNHSTQYAYDALNRQISRTLADGSTYTKRYDPNSNVIEEAQPNGFKEVSVYDSLNRLVGKTITLKNAPAGQETYAYDGLSRMAQAQNFDSFGNLYSTVGFAYDNLSRVTAETQNGRMVSKAYDGVGNVVSRNYPSGHVVDNTYDALNRLTNIKDSAPASGLIQNIFGGPDPVNILNAAYIGKNRPQTFTFGNGTQTNFTYDNLKRLTSLNLELGTQNLERFSYGYDKVGNKMFEEHRTSNLEPRTQLFEYDSLSRLTQAADPSVTQAWTLDKVDNWTSVLSSKFNVLRETQFTPNEVNAYTNVGGQPYIYDENGNLLDDGVHTYQYNYRNLLTRVVNKADGSEVASYDYDPLGRRIFKTVNGQMTRYVYEGVHVIAEIAPDDTISKEFIYGNSIDDPIALLELRTPNLERIYYYHTDGLGSVVSLTDSVGTVAETYKYGAYGEVEIHDAGGALLEESAAGNPFLYTGQRYDSETGFYYYKARYYHPQLGRFLQRDPLGYVDGYNLYAYTQNNPVNWKDPLGFFLLPPVGTFSPFPKDGSYDFKIPSGVPYVGGLEISVSESFSLGLLNVSSTGNSSVVAGGALGLSADISISKGQPNLGSITIGVRKFLSLSLDFSIINRKPEMVGLELSFGLGYGPPITANIPYKLIDYIAESNNLSADLAKRFSEPKEDLIKNNEPSSSFKVESNIIRNGFNGSQFQKDASVKNKEEEHPKKKGVF